MQASFKSSTCSMMKPWNLEVSSGDSVVWMLLRWDWEVLQQNDLSRLERQVRQDEMTYLSEEPPDLQGVEWDNVDVVHQTVGVRHLSSSF